VDIATIVGMFGALGIIVAAILTGGDLGAFIDVPSVLIVVGGTTFAVLFRVTLAQFINSFKVLAKGREIGDPFLQKGIALCIDGNPPEIVQAMLMKDTNLTIERQNV